MSCVNSVYRTASTTYLWWKGSIIVLGKVFHSLLVARVNYGHTCSSSLKQWNMYSHAHYMLQPFFFKATYVTRLLFGKLNGLFIYWMCTNEWQKQHYYSVWALVVVNSHLSSNFQLFGQMEGCNRTAITEWIDVVWWFRTVAVMWMTNTVLNTVYCSFLILELNSLFVVPLRALQFILQQRLMDSYLLLKYLHWWYNR